MKTYFNCKLERPIQVAVEGNQKDCVNLIVKSPRPKDAVKAMALESIFTQAMIKAFHTGKGIADDQSIVDQAKQKQSKETDDEAADSLIQVIMMGITPEGLEIAVKLLKELMCVTANDPQTTIDNIKFTSILFDEIGLSDLKRIFSRYIYYFLSSKLA